MLSCLSVNTGPICCLRHWCSSEYLHISLLHSEFHRSLPDSRLIVSKAVSSLSDEISPLTYQAACAPFTPSKSGQRSPPTYYRGCWHVVSRGLFFGYCPIPVLGGVSSPKKEVYNPKAFFLHAASLHQACAHCGIFLTAASRRSLGRVSVPVWLVVLSDQLRIVALGGRYPLQLANPPQTPPNATPLTEVRRAF